MVVAGKRRIGTGVDARAVTEIYVVDNAGERDENPSIVVENVEARTLGD